MRVGIACLLLMLLLPHGARAEQQIRDLDQLLQAVKRQQQEQRELNRERERVFLADKQRQQQLLKQARSEVERQQAQNQPLLAVTDANSGEIARLEKGAGGRHRGHGRPVQHLPGVRR